MMTTTRHGLSTRPARIPIDVLANDRVAARRHLASLVLGWAGEDQDRLVLPRSPEAAPAARQFVDAAALTWQLSNDQAAAVKLVTSELVTNTIRHATPPASGPDVVVLDLSRSEHSVLVAVSDCDPTPPTSRPRPSAQEVLDPKQSAGVRGAGLAIVGALAVSAGVAPRPSGKTVWALVGAAVAGAR